jgi:hypothetical protein
MFYFYSFINKRYTCYMGDKKIVAYSRFIFLGRWRETNLWVSDHYSKGEIEIYARQILTLLLTSSLTWLPIYFFVKVEKKTIYASIIIALKKDIHVRFPHFLFISFALVYWSKHHSHSFSFSFDHPWASFNGN